MAPPTGQVQTCADCGKKPFLYPTSRSVKLTGVERCARSQLAYVLVTGDCIRVIDRSRSLEVIDFSKSTSYL